MLKDSFNAAKKFARRFKVGPEGMQIIYFKPAEKTPNSRPAYAFAHTGNPGMRS